MKRLQKYTNEPLGRLELVEDFLPPPEQLVLKEDGKRRALLVAGERNRRMEEC
jgi:hypothetical protein